jgi:hypothetical protein
MKSNLTVSIDVDVLEQAQNKLSGRLSEICEEALKKELKTDEYIINLASKEYASAVDLKSFGKQVITPEFKENKNGKYSVVSFFAKKARGQMARYIINHQIVNIEEIKVGRKIGQLKYFIQKKHFDIHTSNYELLPKLKIANLIQKKIHDQTGIIVDLNTIKNYHRFVLIKLLDKFDVGTFNKVIIKSPKAFFQWHLDDIKNNYDLSSIEDF